MQPRHGPLKKQIENVEAFEMWKWTKLAKISRKGQKTNENVLYLYVLKNWMMDKNQTIENGITFKISFLVELQ